VFNFFVLVNQQSEALKTIVDSLLTFGVRCSELPRVWVWDLLHSTPHTRILTFGARRTKLPERTPLEFVDDEGRRWKVGPVISQKRHGIQQS